MKRKSILKLLLMLIALTVFLASCGEDPAPAEPQPEPEAPVVDPVFKSYFDVEFESDVAEILEATRFDAEVVDAIVDDYNSVALILFKTSHIDEMNKVCESYQVYNVVKGEILEPIDNVYDRVGVIPENGASRDDKAISTVTVKFRYVNSILPLVEVRTEIIERIDEETKDKVSEELDGNSAPGEYVTVSDTYDYYDVFGTLVTTCSTSLEKGSVSCYENDPAIVLTIGKITAIFDYITYDLEKVYTNETETVYKDYRYINDNYYYYVNGGTEGGFIEVFDKNGTLVFSKVLHNAFDAFALDNGNIAIQELEFLFNEHEEGDVMIGGEYYDLHTTVVDIATGAETAVDFDYLIFEALTSRDLEKYELDVTANTGNLLAAYVIDNKHPSTEKTKFLVVDNSLNIIFDTPKTYPIEIDSISFENIDDGYLAIQLSAVEDKAIVDINGNIVSFIEGTDKVLEGMVVTDVAIYDYYLKSLFNFKDNNTEFVCTVGNSVIVKNLPEENQENYVVSYEMLTLNENGRIVSERVFDENHEFDRVVGDVVIMKNNKNGKYVIYNSDCEHILTTESTVEVIEVDDKYVAITNVAGIDIAYALN